MIPRRIEVNRESIERSLASIREAVARGESPGSTYSSIAGRDADVTVEHAARRAVGGDPPLVETTVYIDAERFAADASLTPVAYGRAGRDARLLATDRGALPDDGSADGSADAPTRLGELGHWGQAVVESLAAAAASVDGVEPYVHEGADRFDAVCVGVYDGYAETAAFVAQFAVDDAVASRSDQVAAGAT